MIFSRKIFLTAFSGLLAFALLACDSPSRRASVDLSRHSVVYKFEEVGRNRPNVYIYPTEGAVSAPTALMLPFPITQALGPREAEPMSKSLTRILWQAMVKEEGFSVLEYEENITLYSLNQALFLARQKGADILITGNIPYVITGGSTGINQMVVHFEIYDVQSGDLIWSITHSGALNAKQSQDFIFFQRKSKLPTDSLYAVATALGSDIGRVLRDWALGEEENLPEDQRAPELDGGPEKSSGQPPAF